jgi:hypothetical protein
MISNCQNYTILPGFIKSFSKKGSTGIDPVDPLIPELYQMLKNNNGSSL